MPLRDGQWVAEEKHVGSVFVQFDVGVHRIQAQLTKNFLYKQYRRKTDVVVTVAWPRYLTSAFSPSLSGHAKELLSSSRSLLVLFLQVERSL
jgi:hypothetical protein